MTTLAAFLTDFRIAQFQMMQGECMFQEGLALVKEGRARMLLVAADLSAAFSDAPTRTLEALVAPEYVLLTTSGGVN